MILILWVKKWRIESVDRRRGSNLVEPVTRWILEYLLGVLLSRPSIWVCMRFPPSLMDDVDAVKAQIGERDADDGDGCHALDGVCT